MVEIIKSCSSCESEMIIQSAVNPETDERVNEYVCCKCGKTDELPVEEEA